MPRRWQPVPLVAHGLNIPEQTIRTWMRRDQVHWTVGRDGILYVNTSDVLIRRYRCITVAGVSE